MRPANDDVPNPPLPNQSLGGHKFSTSVGVTYGVSLLIVAAIPYFLIGGIFAAMDIYGLCKGRRLQPFPKSDRSPAAIWRCVVGVSFAQLALVLPYVYFLIGPALHARGLSISSGDLPGWGELCVHVVLAAGACPHRQAAARPERVSMHINACSSFPLSFTR